MPSRGSASGREPSPTATTLDDLAADPTQATTLSTRAAVALLARCTVVQSALIGRILESPVPEAGSPEAAGEERLLNVVEAAQRLGTSHDYLYRHAKRLPFTVRIGSRLRFSSRGIERFIRARQGH